MYLATDPFASLFGNESFGSGFADFSTLSKVMWNNCHSENAWNSAMHENILSSDAFIVTVLPLIIIIYNG